MANTDHLLFIIQAKTLEMKLYSLEQEVLCMTYTKEACTELENIRRKMLTKMESVHCEVLKYIIRCVGNNSRDFR